MLPKLVITHRVHDEILQLLAPHCELMTNQTDSTPFVTAARTHVRDGIVAANFLPFGTIIKIPKLFGDKLFVVEDRMHQRKSWMVDIWMPTTNDAIQFGAHLAKIEVVKKP